MKYIVTGSAGFIGYHLCLKLLENKKNKVLGIDNMNNYYSVKVKKIRDSKLNEYKNYSFFKEDLTNYKKIEKIFKNFKPEIIINLAAQAGVRYSLTNPRVYAKSNINGFLEILEYCRYNPKTKLVK